MPASDIQTVKRDLRLANESKARTIASEGMLRMQLNEHKGSLSENIQVSFDAWSVSYLSKYSKFYSLDYCAQRIVDIGDELRRLGFDIKQE